jgi:hypothetical protein
MGKK